MKLLNSTQKMGAAAMIMAFSILISRFMGLIRDKIISWQFGASLEADIYFAAFVIPDFINYLLAGGYLSITLIPILSELFEKDKEDAWKFFGTVFSIISSAIILFTFIAFIFAENFTNLIAPGFSYEDKLRLASFIRIILPAQVFFLSGACFTAILYIRNEFTVPALSPLIYNGSIILFGLLIPYLGIAKGMEGFCIGVLIGSFLGTFLLPLIAVKKAEFKLVFSFKHRYFKRFIILALPLMLGQSIVVLDEQFLRIFGTLTSEGSVSLLNYARRIMLVPVGVVAQATAMAAYPFLASLAAKNEHDKFNQNLNNALTNSLFLIIPLTLYMMLVSEHILGFIFEGGSFGANETKLAAPLLQIMLLSVPFWLIQQLIGRAYYAYQNTITPAIIGTLASFIMLPFYYYGAIYIGAKAIAIFSATSVLVYALVLTYFWQRKYSKSAISGLAKISIKNIVICLPGSLLVYFIVQYLSINLVNINALLAQFIILSISGIIFFALWLILAIIFMPSLTRTSINKISKKIIKKEIFNASNIS